MEVLKAFYILAIMLAVIYGVIKRYYPQGVLLFGGALLLLGALLFSDQPQYTMQSLLNNEGTGIPVVDIYYHLEQLFSYRLSGLGLNIMAIGGFSFFLAYSGAANELIFYSIKPVSKIKNPYLLLGLFYLIGAFLSLFITSAASLGLFCMFTFFPILVSAGVSPLAAVGMIITTECMDVGVLSANTLIAAEVASIDASTYFTAYQIPIFIPTVIVVAVAQTIWQKFMDRKMGYDYKDYRMDSANISREAPGIYALLPTIPFLLIMTFGGSKSPVHINITTAMLISLSIGLLFELLRYRSVSKMMQGLEVYFKGMVKVFPVVSLIICASFFADGLIAMGAIEILINIAGFAGAEATSMIIMMSVAAVFMSVMIGSGNAAFFPIAKLVPAIASKFGVSTLSMIIPLNFVVGIGRSMSPIAAVVIACSDIAQVNPADVIKRSVVPMVAGFITIIIFSLILT